MGKYTCQDEIEQATMILREACADYEPSHIFLFFSGGYDSFVTTALSYEILKKSRHFGFSAIEPKVIHVNTGIGIPQTRDFVRSMSSRYDWSFAEYTTPERYEDIIKQHGFPGPASHRFMYIRLKERAIDLLVRDHTPQYDERQALLREVIKASRGMSLTSMCVLSAGLIEEARLFTKARHARVLFVTGVRRQESARRMGHVQEVQMEGRRVWVAPLLDWSKENTLDYMQVRCMPHNPVVDTTHKSGECLCGSFAHQGELEEVCFWYPETGAYIKELEQLVKREGFPWGWEDAPPSWWNEMKRGQEFLPGLSPLCSSCDARNESYEDAQSGCQVQLPPIVGSEVA